MIPFTKPWRAKKRWENKRKSLLLEDEFYEEKFNYLQANQMVDDDITKRLRKLNYIFPKNKKKLCILAIFRHYNWEEFSLIPALQEFGNVHHFDWSDHIADIPKLSQKLKINKLLIKYFDELQSKDKIDLIFGYFSGEIIDEKTLIYFNHQRIPIINLSLNDRELFVGKIRNGKAQGIRDICKHISISWTSTESAMKKILVEGGIPVYLPEGANPDLHKPYPNEKKIYPVSFVGACYGKRPFVLNELRSKGINVFAFGEGWPAGPLNTEEMVKIYSRSKINLGFSSVGSHDDLYCLKGRDFEITMSGGLYLTEHHEELSNFFRIGEEILTWKTVDELAEKIQFLLSNHKLCTDVSSACLKTSREKHSWQSRIGSVIDLLKK
jgi:spore maturation protein CgeB